MKTRKLQNSKFIRQETTQHYTHRIAKLTQCVQVKCTVRGPHRWWARTAALNSVDGVDRRRNKADEATHRYREVHTSHCMHVNLTISVPSLHPSYSDDVIGLISGRYRN